MDTELLHDVMCGQENVTTIKTNYLDALMSCPAESVLKLLSGKWKPQILYLASKDTIRFNSLLRQLPGLNRQSLAVALRELEEADVLLKNVVKEKPLHIEYSLTERGKSLISIFRLASSLAYIPPDNKINKF